MSEEIPPMPTLTRSPDSVSDHRIDSIIQRFSWFANPDHIWSSPHSQIHPATPVSIPRVYHLRRRPQIQCPACLSGELGQLGHMQRPYGCLSSEETKEELDPFYNVESE